MGYHNMRKNRRSVIRRVGIIRVQKKKGVSWVGYKDPRLVC